MWGSHISTLQVSDVSETPELRAPFFFSNASRKRSQRIVLKLILWQVVPVDGATSAGPFQEDDRRSVYGSPRGEKAEFWTIFFRARHPGMGQALFNRQPLGSILLDIHRPVRHGIYMSKQDQSKINLASLSLTRLEMKQRG